MVRTASRSGPFALPSYLLWQQPSVQPFWQQVWPHLSWQQLWQTIALAESGEVCAKAVMARTAANESSPIVRFIEFSLTFEMQVKKPDRKGTKPLWLLRLLVRKERIKCGRPDREYGAGEM